MIDLKSLTRDENNSSLVVIDEKEYKVAVLAKKAREQQQKELINNSNRLSKIEDDMKELKDDISLIKELLLRGLK